MKKYAIALTGIFLTAGLLTGCSRSQMLPPDTTAPLATVKPTHPTTEPTRATVPAPRPTESTAAPTIEDGNGLTAAQRSMGLFR